MAELKFHKLAELFPFLEAGDQETLMQDIKENGQLEPIVLLQGEILDGRNRHLACQALGIEPITEEYTGSDPLKYVLSKNLHRRHLTTGQRADIATELANMSHGGDRVSEQALNSSLAPVSQAQAAKALKVGVDSVKKMVKLKKEAPPEIIKAVKGGKMSLNAGAKATKAARTVQMKKAEKPPAIRKTPADKWFEYHKANGMPYPEFTIKKAEPIGIMPGDTREKYEARITSIKSDLFELYILTEYAPQMSEELRHLLADELNGIKGYAATIAKEMLGNDNLRGINRPLCDVEIPLRKDDSKPEAQT